MAVGVVARASVRSRGSRHAGQGESGSFGSGDGVGTGGREAFPEARVRSGRRTKASSPCPCTENPPPRTAPPGWGRGSWRRHWLAEARAWSGRRHRQAHVADVCRRGAPVTDRFGEVRERRRRRGPCCSRGTPWGTGRFADAFADGAQFAEERSENISHLRCVLVRSASSVSLSRLGWRGGWCGFSPGKRARTLQMRGTEPDPNRRRRQRGAHGIRLRCWLVGACVSPPNGAVDALTEGGANGAVVAVDAGGGARPSRTSDSLTMKWWPAGRSAGGGARHSGLARCLGRVFGIEATVRGSDPDRR